MKREIPPGVLIAALLVVIGVIGFAAWRMFGPEPPPKDTPEARAAAQRIAEGFLSQAKQAKAGMGGGGGGVAPQQLGTEKR
jgi:hypothetical protein